MHRTTRLAATALSGLAALGLAGPAVAAAPPGQPVHLVVHTVPDAPAEFTASVPGCESGVVTDIDPWAMPHHMGGIFRGTKSFACADGGGFDLQLTARYGPSGSVGTWQVVSGSGDFAGLKGSGSLVGIPTGGGIDDVYTGLFR